MPIPYAQITNFMNSKMYQDKNHPAHKQANAFVDAWFQHHADKLDENNQFKEGVSDKITPVKTFVSDDDLIKRNIPEIKKHEGVKDFPYKDTKGIITVGGGLNVDNFDRYVSLKWLQKDMRRNATPDEIKMDYEAIKKAPFGNYKADFYQKYTKFRLANEEIDVQLKKHLQNDLEQIRRVMPFFDKLPAGVQDVIIDIQYNTGHIERFPKFIRAIQDKNIKAMIMESHRKGISDSRNIDTVQRILMAWTI